MRYIVNIIIVTLFLPCCKPISKIELPHTGTPPIIIYSKVKTANENKNINYDSVMKKFMEMFPEGKISNDDKYNCYFQIKGYSLYKYKGRDQKFTFWLSFQGEEKACSLSIGRIYIMHAARIEKYYFSDRRGIIKRLNPSYEDINNKVNSIMDELVKQIK
ncbi:MAG: hypothetical protein ACT4ON_10450 [Bacteroidota bacterium]